MQCRTQGSIAKQRNYGIDLLRVVAIILITISHVVQTLSQVNHYITYDKYIVDISLASNDISCFVLTLLYYFGALGNSIFFVCSAWFLVRSNKYSKKKWFSILVESWVISILILVVTIIIRHGDISTTIIIKSFLPATFANNWYLTCYLLFYPIHPILNTIIYDLDRRHLFRITSSLFLLYCCLNFIKDGLFFSSTIILWISVYFIIAYTQLYLEGFSSSIKSNIVLLIVGLTCYVGMASITNLLGLHVPYLSDKMLYWAKNCNPFLISVSIALLNLFRRLPSNSRIVSYISSLSLLVYIIHENIILRTYFRPALWDYVYQTFGYDYILIWVFILTLLILLFSLTLSVIYDKSIRYLIRNASCYLFYYIKDKYLAFEYAMMR